MLVKRCHVIALCALLSLIGCVPSVHPIYTDQDCVFDPALVGVWQEDGKKESWEFTKRDDKSYALTYTDDAGLKGRFIVHLAKVQGVAFMDLFPDEPEPQVKINGLYAFHVFPCHTFAVVTSIEPTLTMGFANPQWTQEFLEEHPDALNHEVPSTPEDEGELLLTASTAELQKFWVEHAGTEGAFGGPMKLTKQAQPAATAPAAAEPPKEKAK